MCPARNTESEELYGEKCLLAGKIVAVMSSMTRRGAWSQTGTPKFHGNLSPMSFVTQ